MVEPRLPDPPAPGTQRLDKWLWYARILKSRTQAAALIADGKSRVNRERVVKPSEQVRVGDVVTLTVHSRLRVLKVLAPGLRRGPPAEAARLFEDISPPVAKSPERSATHAARDAGAGRPTKRDRRAIDRLKDDAQD